MDATGEDSKERLQGFEESSDGSNNTGLQPACAESLRAVCKYLVPKPPAISGPVDAGLCRISFPFICTYDNDARLRFIVRVVHTLKGDVIPLDSDYRGLLHEQCLMRS